MTYVDADQWIPQGVDELEVRAWEALRQTERSVCVTAGAGAGKTEFLAQKATYLLQTGLCPPPKRILAISFKRDAADTLRKRVQLRCNESQARRFVSLTFDAFTKSLVDQFRLAIPAPYKPPHDYQITFPTNPIITDFFTRANVTAFGIEKFRNGVALARLPIAEQNYSDNWTDALTAYWQDQFNINGATLLSFAMLNRLADFIVRSHPQIPQILRSTYPIVFLDEFQDTTSAQFQFLLTAFDTMETMFTAVGDDKQKIMGWAGAMPNAFQKFRERCDAVPINFLLNWRSHADLVTIQHVIAQRIDPASEPPEAKAQRTVDGDVSAIWEFDDREQEVEYLANWITSEIDGGDIEPDDIAILVRMRADDIEEELGPVFEERGIALRNIARNVGDIAIQDLLVEPLTQTVIPFLRVGSSNTEPQAWGDAHDVMRSLFAVQDANDDAQQGIASRTEEIARQTSAFMRDNLPTAENTEVVVQSVIDAIDEQAIRQAYPTYHRQQDFDRVRSGLIELMRECTGEMPTWPSVLDRVEGKGQVPLMTVHKSKGLEFHTMIFFGLDSQSWWSLTPDRDEELKSFFVAFTRAMQRAFFTCCNQRGGKIAWIDNLLSDVVERVPPGNL